MVKLFACHSNGGDVNVTQLRMKLHWLYSNEFKQIHVTHSHSLKGEILMHH